MVNLEDPVIKAKIEEAKKLIEEQILEYFKFNTTITTESDGSQSVLVSYELPKDSEIFKVIEGFFLATRVVI